MDIGFQLITAPAFYAVAIPAVLLAGLSKSGFLSGFGPLAVPLMAIAVPVPQAAAIMLPLLLVMDATGLQQLWLHRDKALLRLLLPAGLVGIGLGTALFGILSAKTVAAVVGALTLLFLAQRLFFPPKPAGAVPSRPLGFALGLAAGFTSFVSHAGGPPISAYVLPLRLPPMTTAGTMAVFFAVVNLTKCVPYAALGLFDARNLMTSLVLAPLAPIGVWIGVRLARRIDAAWFFRLAYAGMLLAGAKLLYDGLN